MTEYSRRVPRQPAGWDGVCHIEGESAEWQSCRVIDISMLGIGITVEHDAPSRLVGRHISVDVPAVGDSVSIRLEGAITNAGPTAGGLVRIGIEFDELLDSELGAVTDQDTTDDLGQGRRSQGR